MSVFLISSSYSFSRTYSLLGQNFLSELDSKHILLTVIKLDKFIIQAWIAKRKIPYKFKEFIEQTKLKQKSSTLKNCYSFVPQKPEKK